MSDPIRTQRGRTRTRPGLFLFGVVALFAVAGCASHLGRFREVAFPAPSQPDPQVRPLLSGVRRIGVLCSTDVESLPDLDIEKVMTRVEHAVARQLATRPHLSVVSQDEILWQLKSVQMDSGAVISASSRRALADSLGLDAIVVVELRQIRAHRTPMGPGPYPNPYGGASSPVLDLDMKLRMSLINLHTQRLWEQSDSKRQWTPIHIRASGSRGAEQQVLLAMAPPLRAFLKRVAPPPSRQVREFDLGGS